jgi:hypothetical protein
MKKMAFVVLLLLSALAWAGAEPNPADYTINVHVSSSRFNARGAVRLKVVIDGKKYELEGNTGLLIPGDHKAKLTKDDHKTAYGLSQNYEFLFPDKKTRWYNLVGIME